jgi:polyisoprenoid-binding protein YceI
MKLKFVIIMTAFTLIAVSLTGLFTIPVRYAQVKPAAPPPMKVDHNHSTIGFAVPILGGISKVTGRFTDFDLGVVYDEVDITKSSVNTTIRVASIDTGIADRDKTYVAPDSSTWKNFQPLPSQTTASRKRTTLTLSHAARSP